MASAVSMQSTAAQNRTYDQVISENITLVMENNRLVTENQQLGRQVEVYRGEIEAITRQFQTTLEQVNVRLDAVNTRLQAMEQTRLSDRVTAFCLGIGSGAVAAVAYITFFVK